MIAPLPCLNICGPQASVYGPSAQNCPQPPPFLKPSLIGSQSLQVKGGNNRRWNDRRPLFQFVSLFIRSRLHPVLQLPSAEGMLANNFAVLLSLTLVPFSRIGREDGPICDIPIRFGLALPFVTGNPASMTGPVGQPRRSICETVTIGTPIWPASGYFVPCSTQ